MSVFVSGASGFIGGEVAKTLRRAGFTVYGLVRSQAKASTLRLNEIIPVLGQLSQPDTYREAAERCQIIVDCVGDFSDAKDPASPNRKLLEIAESSPNANPLFIYTSGLLVYSHSDDIIDENCPANNKNMQWRVEYEKRVTGSNKVVGVVIRPGFVYGGSGSFTASLFNVKGDTLVIRGNKEKRWSWVHVHDLADVYLRVTKAERSSIKGEIFNIGGTTSPPTFEEICLKAARHGGFNGKVEYTAPSPSDWISSFADVTVITSFQKACDRLGWKPTHLPFLEDLDVYYGAVKAATADPSS